MKQWKIQQIIQLFRFHMAPELQEANARYLTLPSEFDIHYMYKAENGNGYENDYYSRIGTCVLENVITNYTPNGVKSFADGAPTQITMALTFRETEVLTKEKINKDINHVIFYKFPLITYDIKGNNVRKLLPDILRRVKLRATIKSGGMLFDKYDVKEGEKPEDVAFKWFGDPELHWVILMTNNVTDRYYDWPMNQAQFAEYLTDKYGQMLTQYIITKSQKIVVVQQVKDRVITHI